eukprot:CAMPEP_0114597224 /NCGR_PEP_ID=MMETSP0125-20121206/19458_1 /TAXON_ID=485358 ORGANISM="Aristerostoma sp., Strain ATCC 50986" /NCGR_SAMPLE_ID=MMETSP0125 /ASSEMBLY_ACC=CAM_ASM_000245 /LENGTH=143 /DNA_ID=CAMNT_0001801469 /DNA_START=53 /DNA_END=484 /DNA_ORIENTATION=+
MTYTNFVEIGRVVFIHFGEERGKLAVILDVLNQNKILVEGPTTGVDRQLIPIKRVSLTRLRVPILRNATTKTLTKAINTYGLDKKWAETSTAKRIALKATRARLTDFDRFKAMVYKRRLSFGLKHQVAVLAKGDKKKTTKGKK